MSGCAAGEVFVWDSKRGVALYVLDGHLGSPLLSVSIDEDTGMFSFPHQKPRIIHLHVACADWERLETMGPGDDLDWLASWMDLRPNPGLLTFGLVPGLIATCSDSHVRLWSVSGQFISSISKGQVAGFEVSASAVALRSGAVYSKNEYVITGHSDGRVRFWRVDAAGKGSERSMKCHWTLEGTGDQVTALGTSVGCRELGIGDRNGKAIVWRPSLDAAPPSAVVAALRQQSSAVDAFCSAVDVLGGGNGDVGREPSTDESSWWISRESALQMLLASGDCTEPYFQGWEQPVRGVQRKEKGEERLGVGLYAALYAYRLRSAVSGLEVAMGKEGALEQVDAFVTNYRGSSFAGFWKELQACMASSFSLPADWLDDDMAKWTSPARPEV